MQLDVIAVGRVRDSAMRSACDEYLTRTRRYLKVGEHEVPAARARRPADVRKLEGERLLAQIPVKARGVALTRKGKALDSAAFAERMSAWKRDARALSWPITDGNGISHFIAMAITSANCRS